MSDPTFLSLPYRTGKPRLSGLTHVLDKGITPAAAASLVAGAGDHIDVWKFGWGTAYIDRSLKEKLRLLADHDIGACLGGTLLEIAWAQGKADECLDWAHRQGFPHVEVSRGVVPMSPTEKRELIRRAAEHFIVLAEAGAKDEAHQLHEDEWAAEVAGDLAAGAKWIVAEARESGTVGLYDSAGDVREDIVDAIVDAGSPDRVFFEAPRKDQQAWFIRRFGANVNLANVALDDALSVETLRLGLRADTIGVGCRGVLA
ncbi:phosphosulfolactate synthase [Streptomyces chiangmaiensis]|uniref:Phosphosulfolactate synthase n=1 Tax=Streptomyces chiangmaiensis TaxID=766497 RepID=A0ABU7FL43_9ACTN|nr:phosphosulfolactate synthase [Streptomyces chiangmaiensis]MED7824835.1 phosphosulfolactate synthase [Streptomyces chiangmaiensis]